jgi:hypothetical protein
VSFHIEPTTSSSSATTTSISTKVHIRAATAPTAATAASVDSKLQFSNGIHNKQQSEVKQQQRTSVSAGARDKGK